MIYDGACGFCRARAADILRRDRNHCLRFATWQDADLAGRFPAAADLPRNEGLGFVRADGRVVIGADAVYEVYRRLPGWRWLAWLYRVPGLNTLCRRMYRWFAANRHRLGPSATTGCSDDRRRFTRTKDS
ncbi:MAG: DUF393 domain-containing protein [Planctomycetota bacterium]|nr:MAG: DUF393 domain-containing protein [Planctomycetota bacterium]